MYSKNKRFDFLYFVSPLIIFIVYCLVGVVIDKYTFSSDTRNWSHFAASIFLPSFFILGPVSVLIRFITKDNILLIWIIESLLLLGLLFIFI